MQKDFSMKSIDECPLQNEGKDDEYNFNRCTFLKLGKLVAKKLGLQSDEVASHLLWSNLYKISPIVGGNPSGRVQKEQRQAAIKILQKEIELYKPSHILFITGFEWLEWTWRNSKQEISFAKAFDINLSSTEDEYIKAFGKYKNIPYIVCVRPEKKELEILSEKIVKVFEILTE